MFIESLAMGHYIAAAMTKTHSKYVCQSCAYESARWIGKCPNCGGWNTFVEEVVTRTRSSKNATSRKSISGPVPINEVLVSPEPRIATAIPEFNRVLGGGIVSGSVVLLGGDPGIGKSTLMMQVVSALPSAVCLYITGEESASQMRLRAERVAMNLSPNFLLLAETDLGVIESVLDKTDPDIIVVDSIQTMFTSDLESAPGTVSQVRDATAMFVRRAKTGGIPVFLIGHVTKEGVIAGPKIIEHMVDTVLQFEGEQHYAYRILRATKNRFGSTNEIGIFEMHDDGLHEVKNPSEIFLSGRRTGASGSAVVASMEGTRPLLVEVQALVAPTSYGVPQRTSTGFDPRRLQMILAVLEKRAGLHVGQYDVFVNIAGGVRVDEPAADLGMAMAIASSLRDIPMDAGTVAVGEVGLGGEIRTVHHVEKRLTEARTLGFKRFILPSHNRKGVASDGGVELVEVGTIDDAIRTIVR